MKGNCHLTILIIDHQFSSKNVKHLKTLLHFGLLVGQKWHFKDRLMGFLHNFVLFFLIMKILNRLTNNENKQQLQPILMNLEEKQYLKTK